MQQLLLTTKKLVELQQKKLYEALKDQLANAKDAVRIGEVNQDATSGNITGRGMGFINKFKELAEADGKKLQ